MNTTFEKVFDRILEFQHSVLLASVSRLSNAIGGGGPSTREKSISCKSPLEFKLRDEFDEDYVQIISTSAPDDYDDDEEEVDYITNVVIGLQAPMEF